MMERSAIRSLIIVGEGEVEVGELRRLSLWRAVMMVGWMCYRS